jgi:hypothetical protein
MPAKSKAQYRAMAAAAEGKSTEGIPASVGKEFVAATPAAKRSEWSKGKRKANWRDHGNQS